jgi:hypothetical protein
VSKTFLFRILMLFYWRRRQKLHADGYQSIHNIDQNTPNGRITSVEHIDKTATGLLILLDVLINHFVTDLAEAFLVEGGADLFRTPLHGAQLGLNRLREFQRDAAALPFVRLGIPLRGQVTAGTWFMPARQSSRRTLEESTWMA